MSYKLQYNSEKFHVYLDPEKVWEYIELGKNVDDLYPDHFKEEIYLKEQSDTINAILLPGEHWGYLSNEFISDYVITSLGRIINSKRGKTVKLYYTKATIYHSVRDMRIDTLNEMTKHGWISDVETVKNNHRSNKWKTDYSVPGRY